jgi:uncharacterized protein RhaS with RHS repeats
MVSLIEENRSPKSRVARNSRSGSRPCSPGSAYPRFSGARVGHRYYDNKVGRWMTMDPIGVKGTLNTYSYCDDDPVNNNDFLGLCCDGNFAQCLANCLNYWDLVGKTVDVVLTGNALANATVRKPWFGGTTGDSTSVLSKIGGRVGGEIPGGLRVLGTRNALRAIGRAAAVATVAEGFYRIGNIASCSAICAYDNCAY